jgi:hypothetical protein
VNPQEAFGDMLFAAMMDAATQRKLTQLQTTISPNGKSAKIIRIIVIPEEMDHYWPKDQPLGTDAKKN